MEGRRQRDKEKQVSPIDPWDHMCWTAREAGEQPHQLLPIHEASTGRKKPDTCSLFPLFGDPWPSCLLPSYHPMDCSMLGFPVHHWLLELAQTHVHWVDDVIQPFYPLVTPVSSCPQSFPASGSFPKSWLFSSGGQSSGASASVLSMNIQGWFPLGLTGLIFLLSKGLSSLFQYHSLKASVFWCSAFFMVQLSHPCMTTGEKKKKEARVY